LRLPIILATLAAAVLPHPALAQTPECAHTVGVVVELTGAAGRFGQAAAKSVELAFKDINEAGGAAGCRLAFDLRDSQSQGSVAVDQARQLVDLKRVPAIIGGIISSVSIPVLTAVTAPAGVVQISPASSSPTLTRIAAEGKANGIFFRTITSDALQGTAAAKYALDQGCGSSPSSTSTTISGQHGGRVPPRLRGARRRGHLGDALQSRPDLLRPGGHERLEG
jgi:branched-chain amino acid transport system substrate-binding protein